MVILNRAPNDLTKAISVLSHTYLCRLHLTIEILQDIKVFHKRLLTPLLLPILGVYKVMPIAIKIGNSFGVDALVRGV